MGAQTSSDPVAVVEAEKIPEACRLYLSHHIRNELTAILGFTQLTLGRNSEVYRVIEKRVKHIVTDLVRLGL